MYKSNDSLPTCGHPTNPRFQQVNGLGALWSNSQNTWFGGFVATLCDTSGWNVRNFQSQYNLQIPYLEGNWFITGYLRIGQYFAPFIDVTLIPCGKFLFCFSSQQYYPRIPMGVHMSSSHLLRVSAGTEIMYSPKN